MFCTQGVIGSNPFTSTPSRHPVLPRSRFSGRGGAAFGRVCALAAALQATACAGPTVRTGLVQRTGDQTLLVEAEGRRIRVHPTEAGAPLRYLEGTRVEVTGRGAGRVLRPTRLRVLDGGDGSAPFFGVLRRYGSNWLVDDQNSGSTIQLVEDSLGELAAHEGRLVLIIGYVSGSQRVNVVMWKVLEDVP